MPTALALVVSKRDGQAAVTLTRKMDLINSSLRVFATDGELCIPLKRQTDKSEAEGLLLALGAIKTEEREFSERPPTHRTLTEALRARLPSNVLSIVPRSLDIVGDIAIVELSSKLAPFERAIGEAVLETYPSTHTVMAKAGSFSSDYRIRDLRLIAGADRSVTCHKEHGCLFELDVRRVFFSARLSHERLRVASQVQPDETVLDMFAGVGPYSILVAKKQPTATVHAVDVNPAAFRFLMSNILLNKVHKNVKAAMGDVRKIVKSDLLGSADRAIMNLPGKAHDFVDVACLSIRKNGGIIHFYSFEETENWEEEALAKLNERVEASGRRAKDVLATRIVKEIAPYRVQVAVDARVS